MIKLEHLNLQSLFPNVFIALRLFLTLPVSVASAERSFSKLKILKNYLRYTIGQNMLRSLASMSIETEIAEKHDYSYVIDCFADAKARKAFLKDSLLKMSHCATQASHNAFSDSLKSILVSL